MNEEGSFFGDLLLIPTYLYFCANLSKLNFASVFFVVWAGLFILLLIWIVESFALGEIEVLNRFDFSISFKLAFFKDITFRPFPWLEIEFFSESVLIDSFLERTTLFPSPLYVSEGIFESWPFFSVMIFSSSLFEINLNFYYSLCRSYLIHILCRNLHSF